MTEVIVQFSRPLNPSKAGNFSSYHLAMAGKKRSFAAKKATSVRMRFPIYDGNTHAMTLVPLKPFALTRPVQVVISGTSSTGVTDSQGRFIDGNGDGRAGSKRVAMLTRDGRAPLGLSAWVVS